MRAQITACLILTILATVDVQTIASADDLVKFDSAAYRVGQLQQRQARERGETPPEAPHTTIKGYLSKPDGSGPFPAVVYVHGCSGLSTDTRKRIAERLTAWGYISFVVDSFASRGIKERPSPDFRKIHFFSNRVCNRISGASDNAGICGSLHPFWE